MTTKEGAERWQAKRGTVAERNKYMFNNPLLSDIKFSFPGNDTIIPAHKYVLAVSSSVFFAMFYGDFAETKDTIDIIDCDPDTFLSFLRFIYCDEAIFKDTDSAVKVMFLADKYDVPSLTSEIVKYLDGEMDPRSAFELLTLARQLNEKDLERACWEVIQFHASAIAKRASFQNVKYDLLVSFVQRRSLRIEETTLFQGVAGWAAKRCEEAGVTATGANKRKALGEDLLTHIRFPLIQPKEFSKVVLPEEILTKDEVIDVFKYFSKVPVEGGIKFSVDPREASTHPVLCYYILDSRTKQIHRDGRSFNQGGKLAFAVSKNAFLCGLGFLFACGDSRRRLRLSMLRRGEKMRELSATTLADRYSYHFSSTYTNTPSDAQGTTNVFFNRPIQLQAGTCYTIEVLEASSRSNTIYVSGGSSMSMSSSSSQNDIKYCGGCHIEEITRKDSRYWGYISALLYSNSRF